MVKVKERKQKDISQTLKLCTGPPHHYVPLISLSVMPITTFSSQLLDTIPYLTLISPQSLSSIHCIHSYIPQITSHCYILTIFITLHPSHILLLLPLILTYLFCLLHYVAAYQAFYTSSTTSINIYPLFLSPSPTHSHNHSYLLFTFVHHSL